MKVLVNIVETKSGVDLWGSLPFLGLNGKPLISINMVKFLQMSWKPEDRNLGSLSRIFASWSALLREMGDV